MTSIRISGSQTSAATAQVDADGTLTITIPDPPPAPTPPAAAATVKAPLRIGFHPTPKDYGIWLPKLPTPWFTRVFYPPGKGLPPWAGTAITGLPALTIRHVSFKDQVPAAAITAFLDSIPKGQPVWLTWFHEGDIDWASNPGGYAAYWKTLRQVTDAHPARPQVTLVNVHTQYASRLKRQAFNWRQFVLPQYADVDAWDCYRPATPDVYEDPATTIGLPLAARTEFGTRLHITEFGTHPTSWDTDGTAQAQWYTEACGLMAAAGVEAVGFWCNIDGTLDYRPNKPKVLTAWQALISKYNAASATV
jgi:hypothetical protein